MDTIEPFAEGFVPCLSSGEGQFLSLSTWQNVIQATRQYTQKVVIAGIKRETLQETIALGKLAQQLGCDAIIVPVPVSDDRVTVGYFNQITAAIALPIVIYNTESHSIQSLDGLRQLESLPQIIAIKDSSMNEEFFKLLCNLRTQAQLRLSVLQGFEHLLQVPPGCDGYLIALANLEPELCHRMLLENSDVINSEILDCFWRYNLGADWFVSMKAILMARQVIRSAEQVNLMVQPDLKSVPNLAIA